MSATRYNLDLMVLYTYYIYQLNIISHSRHFDSVCLSLDICRVMPHITTFQSKTDRI
jgi:hypothetical protein